MGNIRKGAVALVTGASSGIGKDTAKILLHEGYVVYAAARRLQQMNELESAGAILLEMDLTQPEQIEAGVQRIQSDHVGIDILINNAGQALYGSVEEVDIQEARHQFEVNIFGPARLTQLAIPHMRRNRSGKIINITSIGGKVYTPLGAWYHATKHAFEGWSDSLRIDLMSFGIDVVVIEPGMVDTEIGETMANGMRQNSGSGPYAALARSAASTMDRNSGQGSSPKVIAELVLRAIRSAKPNTRYAGGRAAKLLLFIRKWFGDRAFDRMILFQMRETPTKSRSTVQQ